MPVRKVIIEHNLPPGDVLAMEAAIHALHRSQPHGFLTDVRTRHPQLFENNPYITPLKDYEAEFIVGDYGPAVNRAYNGYHFYHGWAQCIAQKLNTHILVHDCRPHVYLTDEEKEPWPGLPDEYIVVNAGSKLDFTAKQWSPHRFQQVIDHFRGEIAFVRIGSGGEVQPPLTGVIDLVGQTDHRQLMRVMNRAALVLTPISYPMHLCAALPLENGRMRPCVVIGGRREQRSWEQVPGHTFLAPTGKLRCDVAVESGCWRNKSVRVDRDNSLCLAPCKDEANFDLPECLARITAQDVIEAIEDYEIFRC